ncbi:hypothetical protein [Mesorhizobium sp.]|uniref:hypothetical protein n=1 Tax=Mesorhizobium sp. TaxID=1871066 RepID=UPI00257B4225|nr:hypothetical protein [Mesorhizobium sp.]
MKEGSRTKEPGLARADQLIDRSFRSGALHRQCNSQIIFALRRTDEVEWAVSASLYQPVNVYKPQALDIGVVDGPFEYLTVAGIKLPLPFTTRMTVVRLSNGDLFLHSPI